MDARNPLMSEFEKERLDKLLVRRGIVQSRPRAERLITDFGVRINGGDVVTKPSKPVPVNATLEPLGQDMPWVGRGAYKLLAAVEAWPHLKQRFCGADVLDVGASTGGFTEVALSLGASRVCAVDAGTNQLHEKLRKHPAVWSLEQCRVQELSPTKLVQRWGKKADLFVVDVSFTSILNVVQAIFHLVRNSGMGVMLIKPQFEVGPKGLSRSGVVRDEKLRKQTIQRVIRTLETHGMNVLEEMPSPVVGGDGNIEHLLCVTCPMANSDIEPQP